MFAAASGHKDTVAVLVDKGADVNVAQLSGTTAMMHAAYGGHTETVAVLVGLVVLGGMKRELVPGRWQMVVEFFTGFIDDMLEANIGKAGRKYVPYVFSLFMFILFANLLGLLPLGVVGLHPFTFTSHFTVTGVLAILSFSIVLVVGSIASTPITSPE